MFTTQFNVKRTRREHSTQKSLVSKVPCISNKELIAQALLTGTLVQASNVGYDFADDEKIADYMFDVENQRKLDITERFEFASYVRQKVDSYIKGKLEEKANDPGATYEKATGVNVHSEGVQQHNNPDAVSSDADSRN